MSDPILDFFRKEEEHGKRNASPEPDDYYPGSKIRIQPSKPKTVINRESVAWDENPTIKTIKGQTVEFFTINALALAVGRSVDLVRKWVQHGYIPQSPFRSKGYKNRNGDEKPGSRMYTRSMVDAVVDLFTKHGVIEGRMRWEKTPHLPREIQEEWTRIHVGLTDQSIQDGSTQ